MTVDALFGTVSVRLINWVLLKTSKTNVDYQIEVTTIQYRIVFHMNQKHLLLKFLHLGTH